MSSSLVDTSLRRELEGDRAARVLSHGPQVRGQGQVVDLDDHAIGFVGELLPPAFVPALRRTASASSMFVTQAGVLLTGNPNALS